MAFPTNRTNPTSHFSLVPVQPDSSLLQTPLDVVTEILKHVCSQDIATCKLLCKQFYQIFTLDSVWGNLLGNHFPFFTAPTEIKSFEKAYQEQFRFHSNLKNLVFGLKACRPQEGDAISLAISHGKGGSSIWNAPKGVIKIQSDLREPAINIYDLKTGDRLHTLKGHEGGIAEVLVVENELYSASGDGTVKIWDLETGECNNTLTLTQPGFEPTTSSGVESLAILKNQLFAGCYDGVIRIWDKETGNYLRHLEGHQGGVYCLKVIGNRLFSGSWDNTIKIWDLETGQCISTLSGHEGRLTSLALMHGKLFSSSLDETLKIWDTETGECLNTIPAADIALELLGTHYIDHLTLAPDDKKLFLTFQHFDINGRKIVKMLDFGASDIEIFKQIASLFLIYDRSRYVPPPALSRFLRTPKKARNAIYGELYKNIKPRLTNDYWGCAEHAFQGTHQQFANGAERALAIFRHVETLPREETASESSTG